jgi:hypothetical protein
MSAQHTKGKFRVEGRFITSTSRTYPIAELPQGGVRHSGVDAANASRFVLCWFAHDELTHVLKAILRDLPTKRDWLDPDIERRARAILDEVK